MCQARPMIKFKLQKSIKYWCKMNGWLWAFTFKLEAQKSLWKILADSILQIMINDLFYCSGLVWPLLLPWTVCDLLRNFWLSQPSLQGKKACWKMLRENLRIKSVQICNLYFFFLGVLRSLEVKLVCLELRNQEQRFALRDDFEHSTFHAMYNIIMKATCWVRLRSFSSLSASFAV